jgi:hypothetical protein
MHSLRRLAAGAALAAGLSLGGCPSGGSGGDGTTIVSLLAGSWSGSLAASRVQTVGSSVSPPVTSTKTLSIEFDSEGRPASVVVLGFSGGPDQAATLQNEGDTVTLNSTNANLAVTQVVTVTDATFTNTKTTLVLNIEFTATGGALTQSGTGTQTIEATLSNGALDYRTDVSYDINFIFSGGALRTLETTDCTGILTR